jgi:muramoyltetrapeptide carboxypeptidase
MVAPAGPIPADNYGAGLTLLQRRYRVKAREDLFARDGFLAGNDDRRLTELQAALEDPEVQAVIAARGGYGTMRLLTKLDAGRFARAPKVLVGFSDLTALLAWGHAAGVASIHGPMTVQLPRLPDADLQLLFKLLEDPAPVGEWASSLQPLRGGQAEGVLLGGNLELITRLVGTPWALPLAGAILFIEEVGEAPYRIDRQLTHLALAGAFDGVRGVIVGELTRCEDKEGYGRKAEEVIAEQISRLGVPAVVGAPLGHGYVNRSLPFGGRARLDADRGTVEILEGAVAARREEA